MDASDGVRGAEEATAGLLRLREHIGDCQRCALGATRTTLVFGVGDPRARLLFVGEAPGRNEDLKGEPFVGAAGRLLDELLASIGFTRDDVYIANILKCRPPENRDPRPDEIVSCLPFLQRQIEILNPEVIVALGAHAARTLLNTNQGIGQLRGEFQEYCNGIGRPPIKLIATYHPAYLLRSYTPDNRRRVWEDMKKVLVELGLPVPERGRGA